MGRTVGLQRYKDTHNRSNLVGGVHRTLAGEVVGTSGSLEV